MELNFRTLNACEIEVRIGTNKEGKGATLLLYKDARVDQKILDETVGPMNWNKSHRDDAQGNTICKVGIKDTATGEWVYKEDVGTESNTEAIKGKYSDSFKRACFCWGIGRELYDAPFIWLNRNVEKYEKWYVQEIEYDKEKRQFSKLVICNAKTGEIEYQLGKKIVKKQVVAKKETTETKPKAQNGAYIVDVIPPLTKVLNSEGKYVQLDSLTLEQLEKIATMKMFKDIVDDIQAVIDEKKNN